MYSTVFLVYVCETSGAKKKKKKKKKKLDP